MASAGWYPDPGGQPGHYRWWDGQSWTPHLTPNPSTPPPVTPELRVQSAQPTQPYDPALLQAPRRGRSILTILLAGLVFVALVVGAIWVVNRFTGGIFGGLAPSNPTTDICPSNDVVIESAEPLPSPPPGRVQGGNLSYPELGGEWGPVEIETRVPFGRDVVGQNVSLHPGYDGPLTDWVASVDVGELVAGDGFFSPEQGSEIVTRCVLGVFYGDNEVTRTDVVNQATTVDGYDAWEVEMHLSFSIPGLDETGETAIIVIVATSLESSSIYYASVPDSRPDLLEQTRQVQADLQVEP